MRCLGSDGDGLSRMRKERMYHVGNGLCPEDDGQISEGCWYVETIGQCPYVIQRCKSYVPSYANKAVFWHKKTG
jgi:hypothetical protein